MRAACLILLVAACGGDPVHHIPDAPPPIDAAPDAPPVSGPVTLTVISNGVPQQNVRVLFENADNSLVASTTTDANGTASATMTAGGSVTAIDPYTTTQPLPLGVPPPAELRTYVGVKPGDKLKLVNGTP